MESKEVPPTTSAIVDSTDKEESKGQVPNSGANADGAASKEGIASISTNADGTEAVEVESTNFNEKIKSKKISPFIKQDKSWDDEEYKIPENIKKGILEELNWSRPTKIQNNAIPLIATLDEETKEYENMIAQAKNGAGKSGAFVIGSLLRIDPSIQKLQVIVIGHTRELVNQIT